MPKRIESFVKGSEDTLLKTERANELVGTVNALAGMTFIPANAATLDVGDQGGAVMKFNLDVLGGGGGGGGGMTPQQVEDLVRALLSTATVFFNCQSPGSINVTFTLPPAGPP